MSDGGRIRYSSEERSSSGSPWGCLFTGSGKIIAASSGEAWWVHSLLSRGTRRINCFCMGYEHSNYCPDIILGVKFLFIK